MDFKKLHNLEPKISDILFLTFSKFEMISLRPVQQAFSYILIKLLVNSQIFLLSFFLLSIFSSVSLATAAIIFPKWTQYQALMFLLQRTNTGQNSSLEWSISTLKYSSKLSFDSELKKVLSYIFQRVNFFQARQVIMIFWVWQKSKMNDRVIAINLLPTAFRVRVNSFSIYLQESTIYSFSADSCPTFSSITQRSSQRFLQLASQALKRLFFSSMLYMILTSVKDSLQKSMFVIILLWLLKYFLLSQMSTCSWALQERMQPWKLRIVFEKLVNRLSQRAVSSRKLLVNLSLNDLCSLQVLRYSCTYFWQYCGTSISLSSMSYSQSKMSFSQPFQNSSKFLTMFWKCSKATWVILRYQSDFLSRG